MHPFSIDFITRVPKPDVGLDYSHYHRGPDVIPDDREDGKQLQDGFRRTPSPTDSGMESDHSPIQNESAHSIAETLLSLEKRANRAVAALPAVSPPGSSSSGSSDEKPPHSYIALISIAILSQPDRKMLLGEIYQYIMENFPFYSNEEKAWKNSIRHNLSLNECFVKNGRADNGKGNYWSIHPACEEDFAKGDFRRRQARRRARKNTKECGSQDIPMPYRYNVGYVPMTASHIGYHPYGAAASSLLYSQQPMSYPTSYPVITSPQTRTTQSLMSRSAQLPNDFSQQLLASSAYMPSQMTPSSQSSPLSSATVAAAHRLFSEQTSAMYGSQTFSTNRLTTGLQFQNW